MNLRDLEYFVAVAELQHFRKAAERCFVSQPALSGQLKKLEEELGLALFHRHTREVQLTLAGQTLLKSARQILSEVNIMRDAALALRDPRKGSFKIGAIPTLAPYLMPAVMKLTSKLHPKLELYLSEMQTHLLLEALATGSIEAGFMALPVSHVGMVTEVLFDELFWLAVPINHLLANKPEISVSDLQDQSLYLLEDGHCLKDQVMEVCNQGGAREHLHFRASSLETLRQMINSGTGATLMPGLAVAAQVSQSPSIRYIPFSAPRPHRTITLVWRKGSPREKFLISWAKEIRKSKIKQLMPQPVL
jgi:LysR family transcriptional regulator, hydrogen peroxide-inducible genes activator